MTASLSVYKSTRKLLHALLCRSSASQCIFATHVGSVASGQYSALNKPVCSTAAFSSLIGEREPYNKVLLNENRVQTQNAALVQTLRQEY